MIISSEYAAYPIEGTHAMQQAWRLYFDEKSLRRGESYLIKKKYPQECRVMYETFCRSFGDGVTVSSKHPLTSQQSSYIEQKFINLLDLAFENPEISIPVASIVLAGMTSAAVLFLPPLIACVFIIYVIAKTVFFLLV